MAGTIAGLPGKLQGYCPSSDAIASATQHMRWADARGLCPAGQGLSAMLACTRQGAHGRDDSQPGLARAKAAVGAFHISCYSDTLFIWLSRAQVGRTQVMSGYPGHFGRGTPV